MQSVLVLLVTILSTIATAVPRPEKELFSSIHRAAGDGSSLLVQRDESGLQNPESGLYPQQFRLNEVAFTLTPDTLTGVTPPEAVPNLTQLPAGVDPTIENSPGLVQTSPDFDTNLGQNSIWSPAFTIADAQIGGSVQALDDAEIKLQAKEDRLKRFEDALLGTAKMIPMPDLIDRRPDHQERGFADWVKELTQEDSESEDKEATYAIRDNQEKSCCHDVTSPSVAGKFLTEATSVRQNQYTAWQTRLDLYSQRLNERGQMLNLKKRANTVPDDEDRHVLGDFLYAWHISASHRTEDLIFRDRVASEANLACCRFTDSMKRDGRPPSPLPPP